MSIYKYGERVWAQAEGKWWPAKVVVGSDYGISHTDNEVVIKYYSSNPDDNEFDVLLDSMLAPYEESSEKAVALDDDLNRSMEACRTDTDALPLRELPVVSFSSKRARDGDEADGAASKHHRQERKQHLQVDAAYGADAGSSYRPSSSSKGTLAISKIQAELIRATNSNDIINARRALLKLGTVKMTYSILRETRVGISVAGLLGLENFKALHPLARAIVCDWAQKLPEETIKAIKHELEVTQAAELK